METFTQVIAVIVVIGLYAWGITSVWHFINEVPKQLKRIADALEKLGRS